MQERRKYTRWQISSKLIYKLKGVKGEDISYCKDVSMRGLRFSSKRPLSEGEILELCIYLTEDFFSPLRIEAEVRWQRELFKEASLDTGVEFKNIKEKDKDKIFKYLFKNYREQILQQWWRGVK
jgi:c-di-GMP-binding flagellar brake protein YcgR